MKKIDNGGWGIPTFLLYLGICILVLILITVLVYRAYAKYNIPIVEEEYINISIKW